MRSPTSPAVLLTSAFPDRPVSLLYQEFLEQVYRLRISCLDMPIISTILKTVLRSGYGIFWIPNYAAFSLNPLNDMVNGGATTYVGTVDGTHPVNTIALPFPAGISPPPGLSLGTAGTQQFLTQVVQSITEVNRSDHPEGYVQQWNLDLQRDLPAGFFVSAAYVGSKGTHLPQYSQQINQISDALLAQAAAQVDPSLPNPRQNVTLV